MLSIVRRLLAFVTTLGLLAACAAVAHDGERHPPAKAGSVLVAGRVEQRLRLDTADLAALPQQAMTVSFLAGSGYQTHTYTGPLLADVLKLAKPAFDPAVKNDKLRHHVLVTGADGYEVVLAWGEFDSDFEAKKILVAITEDGASLAATGPRLVVPGDTRGGRYVSNVVGLRLRAPAGRD